MKLNLGCGKDFREGWVNVDIKDADINADIRSLPFKNDSASHIMLIHVLEHFSFIDEEKVWKEVYRVLRPTGLITVEIPDLYWICQQLVEAQDTWKTFYKITNDPSDPNYGFGSGPGIDVVHGQLMTYIFGSQTTPYHFHTNGYTRGKIVGIAKLLNLEVLTLSSNYNKGSKNIFTQLRKK